MAHDHTLTVGSTVAIHSGYTHKQVGTGTVVRVLTRWVLVEARQWAVPVKFRTCAPLKGHRITGGLAEHLNDWIRVPTAEVDVEEAGQPAQVSRQPDAGVSDIEVPVPPYTLCHTLRRVLVRLPAKAAGYDWTIRACGMPLFSDLECASGVCRSCTGGWTHPEDHPVVPVFDAVAHARFSLRHWRAMQDQAATPADLARAVEGVAVWSARVATLARLAAPIASELGSTPV